MEQQLIQQELENFVGMIDSFPASDSVSKFYRIESLLSPIEDSTLELFFGKVEYNKALKLIYEAQDAIKKCKIGDLDIGFNDFQTVYSKSLSLSINGHQYVNLYYLSGLAYYYYRKQDFTKALSYTLEEIQETQDIESKGATILHYRRTGHVLNLIKIFQSMNENDKVLELSFGLIQYLLIGDKTFMPDGNWESYLLNYVPYIKQRALDITFMQTVDIFIKYGDNDAMKSLIFWNVFDKLPEFEPQNDNQAMIYNWIYLQKHFFNNRYTEFINESIEFCQTPFDSSFDSLKLSLLPNIIYLNNINRNSKYSYKLNNEIKNFTINKLSSSEYLKNYVYELMLE